MQKIKNKDEAKFIMLDSPDFLGPNYGVPTAHSIFAQNSFDSSITVIAFAICFVIANKLLR